MRITIVAALACVGSLCAVGCEGKLQEIVPHDMSAHIADGGDGGGGMVDLGPPKFSVDIQKSLNGYSCASAGCHLAPNGNEPKFVAMPMTATDLMANYMSFMAESTPTTPGDNSTAPILTNLLVGSSHAGIMPFANTSDPTYQLWLSWINDGEQF